MRQGGAQGVFPLAETDLIFLCICYYCCTTCFFFIGFFVTSEIYHMCFVYVVFLLMVRSVPAKPTFAESWVVFLW